MEQKKYFYDLVVDESGKFIDGDNSFVVGFLLEDENNFLLSERYNRDGNDLVRIVPNNKLMHCGFPIWYAYAQEKIKSIGAARIRVSDFDHMGEFDYYNRTQIQKELFDKYKYILDTIDGNCWKLCAFKQSKSVLNKAVPHGEAASINYLETWADGLLALIMEESLAKCSTNTFYNIGIASRTYSIVTETGSHDSSRDKLAKRSELSLSIGDYRKAFRSSVVNRLGEKAYSKFAKKVNFYSINSINGIKDNKNEIYKNYHEGSKVKAKDVTMQFMLTIADCFANTYLNKDRFNGESISNLGEQLFEFDGKNVSEYKRFWEIQEAIFESDLHKVITKLVLFPSLKLDKEAEDIDADWNKKYNCLQDRFTRLIDELLIPNMLIMDIEKRKADFEKIKSTIREQVKTINTAENLRLIIKLDGVAKLYERLSVQCDNNCNDIHKFGADIYLFLANRYQNIGNSEKANDLLQKAFALRDSWSNEQIWVYLLLILNDLNDKFQFNMVYEKYHDIIKRLKKNTLNDLLGDVTDTNENKELRGKVHSIFLESLITSLYDWDKCQEVYKKGVDCFGNWKDKEYILSNYFRAALSHGQLRVAKRVFLSSLKEDFYGVSTKGNFSIVTFFDSKKHSISEDDFYEDVTGRFRPFVYLNYLSLIRELVKENDSDAGPLVKCFLSSEEVLKRLANMESSVYPCCLIYWRLGQIHKYMYDEGYEGVETINTANEFYLKALRILDASLKEKNNMIMKPRLLAIKISLISDYIQTLQKERIPYDELKDDLNSSYNEFKEFCGIIGLSDVFKSAMVKVDFKTIKKAIPDYY